MVHSDSETKNLSEDWPDVDANLNLSNASN